MTEPIFILDLNEVSNAGCGFGTAYADDGNVKRESVSENAVNEEDVENILGILDNFAGSDTGRLKLIMDDSVSSGKSKRIYHHGRCDIGSPFATGKDF